MSPDVIICLVGVVFLSRKCFLRFVLKKLICIVLVAWGTLCARCSNFCYATSYTNVLLRCSAAHGGEGCPPSGGTCHPHSCPCYSYCQNRTLVILSLIVSRSSVTCAIGSTPFCWTMCFPIDALFPLLDWEGYCETGNALRTTLLVRHAYDAASNGRAAVLSFLMRTRGCIGRCNVPVVRKSYKKDRMHSSVLVKLKCLQAASGSCSMRTAGCEWCFRHYATTV
jgi:hypothetical protein